MNPTIVNPQTGTELLPVPPAPLANAAPHASMDLRFDLDSIVAIGVNETLAALDTAKRKIAAQLEATTKFLNEKRRELADELADHGCPELRDDIEVLTNALSPLGESGRVAYTVDEPNRKTRVYTVRASVNLLRHSPLSFSRDQAMLAAHEAILDTIEDAESRHGKLAAALSELGRRSNEATVTRTARAAAARHVYSQSTDGRKLVDALTASVIKSDDILADLLPGENF